MTDYFNTIPENSFPLTTIALAVEKANRVDQEELVNLRRENEQLKEEVKRNRDEVRRLNSFTKYNMQEDFKSYVKGSIMELLDYTHPQDLLTEWVDGHIPHSNWELLQYAASDYAFTEPDDPGCIEGVYDIHRIIQWCCSEVLHEAAYEAIQEVKEEGFISYMVDKWEAYEDRLEKYLMNLSTEQAENPNAYNEKVGERHSNAEDQLNNWRELQSKLEDF